MNTSTYTLTTSEHLITASVVNSSSNNALRRKTHCRISYYDNDFARHKMTWIATVFFIVLFGWQLFRSFKNLSFSLRYVISAWSKLCKKKKHLLQLILARCAMDVILSREKFVESSMITGTLFVKKIETLLICIKWLNSRCIVRGDMIFLPCYMYVNHNTKVLSPRSALLPRHQWNLLSNETRVKRIRANVDNGE